MSDATPPGGERGLTPGEIALVGSVFGEAVDCLRVRIRRRRWHPLQPRGVTMAPMGHIHFHPRSPAYSDDFARETISMQGFFLHEMTHVWQSQRRGRAYLLSRRHPFSRYRYRLRPGPALHAYGPEQQAEIVRHAFLLRQRGDVAGGSDAAALLALVARAMAKSDAS